MEDTFCRHKWALVYIDCILICSKNLQEHLKHLQEFYKLIFQHGLVFSKSKMKNRKTEIEFLGFMINKDQVILQDHVLKVYSHFPKHILEKVQHQIFFGSLNYIRAIYRGQAKDIHILQQRLKKNPPSWSPEMTKAIQRIKEKVHHIPTLSLPPSRNWKPYYRNIRLKKFMGRCPHIKTWKQRINVWLCLRIL